MIVVLDTNVVIRMFGRQSTLRRLVEAISYGQIHVAVSPAIWLEYEEVCLGMQSPGHWEKLQTQLVAILWNALGLRAQGTAGFTGFTNDG